MDEGQDTMNAPTNIQPMNSHWSEKRFGPDTQHWLPRNSDRAIDHIPGEDGMPVIGNTLEQLGDYRGFTNRMVAKYGRVYRNNSFGGRSVALHGPEANELVMFDRDKIFSSEQGWGPVLNLLFPRGLMLMDFEKHRADRKILSVAFKPEPMRHYAESLNEGFAIASASGAARPSNSIPRSRN